MRFIYLILSFFIVTQTSAQIVKPVTWKIEAEHIKGNEYNLIYKAKIDENWGVYSQFVKEGGPEPTVITYDESSSYKKIGKAVETGHKKEGFDEMFQMDIIKFIDNFTLTQKIEASDVSKPVTGYLTFMCCDNTRCLPPTDIDFNLDLSKLAATSTETAKTKEIKQSTKAAPTTQKIVDHKTNKTPIDAPTKSGQITVVKNPPQPVVINPTVTNAPASEATKPQNKSGILTPVTWTYDTRKIDDTTYELIFKAQIQENWSVYSHYLANDDGPIRTTMHFDTPKDLEMAGTFTEASDHPKQGFDKMFDMDILKFQENATFTQKIKVKDLSTPIVGWIEYMTCDNSRCIAKQEDFTFSLDGSATTNVDGIETEKVITGKGAGTPIFQNFDYRNENVACGEDVKEEKSGLWWIFFAGFLGGLVALLTPCVFPMIPLTVSFFTKSSTNRATGIKNALIYGLSIIIIYVTLGMAITLIAGPDALNAMSTDPWFNVFFFLLFIVFAISFFGYFEITLPSSWTNKADSNADKGGLIGIFFMAFTLSLVSFSCTGPIIGSLLVQASTAGSDALFGFLAPGPLVGMFGFSLALALPFALFAAFPAWLNSLPKSGGWMTTVKVTLGFVEVALAFKFLSVADMVMHWNILPYELFIVIWALCAIGLGLYYFNILRFAHDYKMPSVPLTRRFVGVLLLILGIYFFSGLRVNKELNTFTNLSVLSGLAPPVGHSWFYPKHCPLDINCFDDFDQGLAYAKKVGKPILLDFTGFGCVNCRKMENNVWNKPGIHEKIRDKYVLISLFVDDKTKLENSYISSFNGSKMRTIGNKWSDFETVHFKRNSQPYYVLLSEDLKVLNKPVGYTPDLAKYENFLKCGLNQYNKLKK